MHFYTSIFKNSKPGRITRFGHAGPESVMSVTFELYGLEFFALIGGPTFSFTPDAPFGRKTTFAHILAHIGVLRNQHEHSSVHNQCTASDSASRHAMRVSG